MTLKYGAVSSDDSRGQLSMLKSGALDRQLLGWGNGLLVPVRNQ